MLTIIKNYYSSLNILTGFAMGIGIQYAMGGPIGKDIRRDMTDVLCAILAPGLYCGMNFFNILHTGRMVL